MIKDASQNKPKNQTILFENLKFSRGVYGKKFSGKANFVTFKNNKWTER